MSLLQQAQLMLFEEHKELEADYLGVELIEYHQEVECDVCDLLREIDKALQTGSICDCHP